MSDYYSSYRNDALILETYADMWTYSNKYDRETKGKSSKELREYESLHRNEVLSILGKLDPNIKGTPSHRSDTEKILQFLNNMTTHRTIYAVTKDDWVNEFNGIRISTVAKEPYIGMTRQELQSSTWGQPSTINKILTQSGTHEQWVYDKKGYIYIDENFVTAIQTRN